MCVLTQIFRLWSATMISKTKRNIVLAFIHSKKIQI